MGFEGRQVHVGIEQPVHELKDLGLRVWVRVRVRVGFRVRGGVRVRLVLAWPWLRLGKAEISRFPVWSRTKV